MNSRAVIVGAPDDPHVEAVASRLASPPLILDVQHLTSSEYRYGDGQLCIRFAGESVYTMSGQTPARGWFRRLAPAEWQDGTRVGSLRAAESSAWLTLFGAWTRGALIEWLSAPDDAMVAENKLGQLAAARSLGIRMPRTVVTNDPNVIDETFPSGNVVIKPLGSGHFRDDEGSMRIVMARTLEPDIRAAIASSPPMLLQERLLARRHLRVVTVGSKVWTAALDASGLPLDWRADDAAHASFQAAEPMSEVSDGAKSVAEQLCLGYSSQDWIETTQGVYLLDVNPGGQWLFLPQEIADEVSWAIAAWLEGSDE